MDMDGINYNTTTQKINYTIMIYIMQPTKVFEVLNGKHPLPEQSEQLQKPWKLPPFVGNVGRDKVTRFKCGLLVCLP